MRACFLVWSLQLCTLAAEGSLQAWECENTAAAQYSPLLTPFLYFYVLPQTFGKAVMFVICSCISGFFFFYSNRSALIWGQSWDLWSNFLAESRFSSAVSWKNFQCLLKIARGGTLWALIHKHTLTLVCTRLSALAPSVSYPTLHHLEM